MEDDRGGRSIPSACDAFLGEVRISPISKMVTSPTFVLFSHDETLIVVNRSEWVSSNYVRTVKLNRPSLSRCCTDLSLSTHGSFGHLGSVTIYRDSLVTHAAPKKLADDSGDRLRPATTGDGQLATESQPVPTLYLYQCQTITNNQIKLASHARDDKNDDPGSRSIQPKLPTRYDSSIANEVRLSHDASYVCSPCRIIDIWAKSLNYTLSVQTRSCCN